MASTSISGSRNRWAEIAGRTNFCEDITDILLTSFAREAAQLSLAASQRTCSLRKEAKKMIHLILMSIYILRVAQRGGSTGVMAQAAMATSHCRWRPPRRVFKQMVLALLHHLLDQRRPARELSTRKHVSRIDSEERRQSVLSRVNVVV